MFIFMCILALALAYVTDMYCEIMKNKASACKAEASEISNSAHNKVNCKSCDFTCPYSEYKKAG